MRKTRGFYYLMIGIMLILTVNFQPVSAVHLDEGETAQGFDLMQAIMKYHASMPAPVSVEECIFLKLFDFELSEELLIALAAVNYGPAESSQAAFVAVDIKNNDLYTPFGDNGVAFIDFSGERNVVTNIAVHDDKILAAGNMTTGRSTTIGVARFETSGIPDASFGTDGYTYYSQFTNGLAELESNQANIIAPVYNDQNSLQGYAVGGSATNQEMSGRALIFFDPQGQQTFPETGVYDPDWGPVQFSNINGAIVQEPASVYQGFFRGSIAYNAYSTGASGTILETFFYDHGQPLSVVNGSYYNPFPEYYPDRLINLLAVLPGAAPNSYYFVGNYLSDPNEPEYDINQPFGFIQSMTEPGRMQPENIPIEVIQHDGYVEVAVVAVAASQNNGALNKAGDENGYLYIILSGEREDGDGNDLLITRHFADGTNDYEYGEDGTLILNPGRNSRFAASAINSEGELLIGFYDGDEDKIYFTLLNETSETSVQSDDQHMTGFMLHPVYPNPFNPETVISFDLPKTEKIHLSVFDIRGREIQTLLTGTVSDGAHQISWDASGLSSGTYFIRLESDSRIRTQKAVYIR